MQSNSVNSSGCSHTHLKKNNSLKKNSKFISESPPHTLLNACLQALCLLCSDLSFLQNVVNLTKEKVMSRRASWFSEILPSPAFERRATRRECERSGTIHTSWELNPRPDHPHTNTRGNNAQVCKTVLAQIKKSGTSAGCNMCILSRLFRGLYTAG